jgi:molybdenum cofactor cytidylyltransferase
MNAAAVILAAGASTRLGQPKQLLQLEGQTLLRRTVLAALNSRFQRVVIVTGAAAEACTAEVADLPVGLLHNPQWADGLAGSIQVGIVELSATVPCPDCISIAVCDQPHLDNSTFNRLLDCQAATGRGIVASRYSGALGVPALFMRKYYPALLALTGDAGAKSLFRQFATDCASIEFPEGAIDIDSPADYAAALAAKDRI